LVQLLVAKSIGDSNRELFQLGIVQRLDYLIQAATARFLYQRLSFLGAE